MCASAYPEARLNKSLALLSTAEFGRGWAEYEWRWKMPHLKPPKFKQPRWDGKPLDGRTLLLHAEQGQGQSQSQRTSASASCSTLRPSARIPVPGLAPCIKCTCHRLFQSK